MNIFGFVLALTLACQPPPDNRQVGLWESAATSRGGIGNIMEYKSDGSYIYATVILVDLKYDVKDGMLFTAKNRGEQVSYENGTKITITSDAYSFINQNGMTEVRNRISTGNSDSIVGEYRYRHYTDAIAYEKYTKDGFYRLRIPMTSDSGCYLINSNDFILNPSSKNPTKMPYKIDSGKLTLVGGKGSWVYNFVTEGSWYKGDDVDYIGPYINMVAEMKFRSMLFAPVIVSILLIFTYVFLCKEYQWPLSRFLRYVFFGGLVGFCAGIILIVATSIALNASPKIRELIWVEPFLFTIGEFTGFTLFVWLVARKRKMIQEGT